MCGQAGAQCGCNVLVSPAHNLHQGFPEWFFLEAGIGYIGSRNDQRIIFVANNYRKEVTSTVLWLINYKVRVQCFRATPFSMGDELFVRYD